MKFPIKQSYTVAAANLTGFKSNATGASFVLTATTPGDGLAHQVTVKNDSATDHSGKTIALVGFDANNRAQTETLTGPAGSATVTSTKFWSGLTSPLAPSETIGADTFDIGWAAAAVSPWVDLEWWRKSFSASVAVVKAGTINYDVEHAYDKDLAGATPFKHGDITGSTANDSGTYLAPVTAVRVNVNSHTGGSFDFHVLQGERD
jgi:hypothetical protein